MIPWYLVGLLVAISCLSLIDYTYKLALFFDRSRTLLTLAAVVGLFALWDIFGIRLGIFFHGGSSLTLPIRLVPEFPLEEIFFLILLAYSALLAYRFFGRKKS